jgi:dephospho-CoA kinase
LPVIDADQVSRDVVAPGEATLSAISARFGSAVLQGDGSLDRAALGAIVFEDQEARQDLEALIHPPIIAETMRRIAALAAAGHALAIVSAALMVESGSYKGYAGLLVVTCEEQEQLRRLMARDGLDERQARARIGSQLSQKEKAAVANVIIDNSGERDELEVQVEAWLATLKDT